MDISRMVILTGAGISAESGLDTFRDQGGLWERVRIEDVATPEAWRRDPEGVQQFYNRRRRQLNEGDIHPNPAHQALARLEREFPGEVLVVTQNVDNLHERAGSINLVHMHGELNKVRCNASGRAFPLERDLAPMEPCRCCTPPAALRPHVVWFGEMPMEMDRIQAALERCDLFVSIGTSGNVYPAAGFVELASAAGARSLELNLEPSDVHGVFDEHRTGPASELVPEWVEAVLKRP